MSKHSDIHNCQLQTHYSVHKEYVYKCSYKIKKEKIVASMMACHLVYRKILQSLINNENKKPAVMYNTSLVKLWCFSRTKKSSINFLVVIHHTTKYNEVEESSHHKGSIRNGQQEEHVTFLLCKSGNYVVYLMKMCPVVATRQVTPQENHYGRKVNMPHYIVFGSIVNVHVPNEVSTKLDPKLEKCIRGPLS